ncbi:hypothetical protein KRZ98_16780 [Sphingobium sp. AS12]|uniref:hypothetical protein n=1 Tax=Sphingobium sp. AS12 TaxID=2849495 RepID=UPI001C3175C8|nr:hypothetical protein [Sphingobium sp. AS12]MBV2149901.1 hypothetical protein [Sphingobium sp. AS12]
MRLTDQLAARRRLYSLPLITAPALMVIDIPAPFGSRSLALGRYYPVIIETNDELTEFESFLDADRPNLVAPDLLDHRPSNREASAITFFELAPPAPGWPWLLLCHWPRPYASLAGTDPNLLARGAYTTETFLDRGDLLTETARFIDMLGRDVELRVIPPMDDIAGHS